MILTLIVSGCLAAALGYALGKRDATRAAEIPEDRFFEEEQP